MNAKNIQKMRRLINVVRISLKPREHHPNCNVSIGSGSKVCDCYARISNEIHDALDELMALLKQEE